MQQYDYFTYQAARLYYLELQLNHIDSKLDLNFHEAWNGLDEDRQRIYKTIARRGLRISKEREQLP